MLRTLLAPNPSPMTLDGTRTFLVGHSHPVVIDPGPSDPVHLRAILDALAGARPAAILLTHSHPDHAALAGELSRQTGSLVTQADADTDAGAIRAIPTPGHTADHVSFQWEDTLFVGDLFMGEGNTTLVAPPEGNLRAYLASLERVREIAPQLLYPAHGPPITNPVQAVGRYRRHREDRIQQVRDAMRRTRSSDPALLVRSVYGPELHPELRSAAEGSVRAILDYLR
ncbi:MAG: MBL fold metallo-hydrolase [Gemmatimonadota bacterium]|nr:MBL fold metallo-hydrolase [Gemmatimonadota bacterium]